MIDFNRIKFVGGKFKDIERDRKSFSFVGIKRNSETQELEFWLPLGFQNFDNTDFDLVKKFFFSMYRTFKNYIARKFAKIDELEKKRIENEYFKNNRDGLYEKSGGFAFKIDEQDEVVLYSKLNALDKILEGYDELKISSLSKKNVNTTEIDYSQIHNYLHQAIYLEDDVAFIDEMRLAKTVIMSSSPAVVQLFCFIFCEIKKELGELYDVPDRAMYLSELFKENYLNPNSSLFEQETFQDTILILKDTLHEIIDHTPYKDEDFWHFYEAIEAFLYGENDFKDKDSIYWGIKNFYDVWEDMCQFYMLNYPHEYAGKLLYADIGGWLKDNFITPEIAPNPFYLTLDAPIEKPKVLRPDLVYYELGSMGKTWKFDDVFELSRDTKKVSLECKDDRFKDLYYTFLTKISKKEKNDITYPKCEIKITKSIKQFNKIKNKIEKEVGKKIVENNGVTIKIIDYKYKPEWAYNKYKKSEPNPNEKKTVTVTDDIQKQLVYEWTVQENFKNEKVKHFPVSTKELQTESEFWIPYYSDEENDFLKKEQVEGNALFKKNNIAVYKVNFKTLQNFYISP